MSCVVLNRRPVTLKNSGQPPSRVASLGPRSRHAARIEQPFHPDVFHLDTARVQLAVAARLDIAPPLVEGEGRAIESGAGQPDRAMAGSADDLLASSEKERAGAAACHLGSDPQ